VIQAYDIEKGDAASRKGGECTEQREMSTQRETSATFSATASTFGVSSVGPGFSDCSPAVVEGSVSADSFPAAMLAKLRVGLTVAEVALAVRREAVSSSPVGLTGVTGERAPLASFPAASGAGLWRGCRDD